MKAKLVKESLNEYYTPMGNGIFQYMGYRQDRILPYVLSKQSVLKRMKEAGFTSKKELEYLAQNGVEEMLKGNFLPGMEHIIKMPEKWKNIRTEKHKMKLADQAQEVLDQLLNSRMFLNEYSIWDREREETEEILSIQEVEPFNDEEAYEYAYNKPLFNWLRELHEKYNEEDGSEAISQMFLRIPGGDNSNERTDDFIKKYIYKKLRNLGYKMPFIREFFTRFNELKQQARRL